MKAVGNKYLLVLLFATTREGYNTVQALATPRLYNNYQGATTAASKPISSLPINLSNNDEWQSDFDDFAENDGDSLKVSDIFQSRGAQDLSSCRTRQVRLELSTL